MKRSFLILLILILPSAYAVCSLKDIPATCIGGGNITVDNFTGGCRYLQCFSSQNGIVAKACEKPDIGTKTYFEFFTGTPIGSGLQLCLGAACIGDHLNGFIRANLTCNQPPQNQTNNNTNNTTSNGSACFPSLRHIPATCTGGNVTNDTFQGGCRTILCENGPKSLKVKACEKPDAGTKQYFEMYKQAQNGTGLSICIENTCINGNNFAKSPQYPICSDQFTCCTDESCFRASIDSCRAAGGAVMECAPTPKHGNTIPPTKPTNYTKTNTSSNSSFIKNLTKAINESGVHKNKYNATTYDCDDFADDLERNLTARGFNATYTYYWCVGPPAFGHAITDIHAPDGTITFVEPQTGQIVNLDFDGDGKIETRTEQHVNSLEATTDDNCAIEVFDSAASATASGAPRD